MKSRSHVQLFVIPWTPGSSIHGILQARILECFALSFSRGSSRPTDQNFVSCIFQIVPRETPHIGDDIGRLERRGSDLLVWASIANYCRLQGGTSGKGPACQCRRHKRLEFKPWVGKIPWRKKCQPTSVFLPGESHEQGSLASYSPWRHQESDTTE